MAKKKKPDKPKRPVGRPRLSMEFEDARELVRNERLSSKAQYLKWWELNTPARIPRRPDTSFRKSWKGWNDFLGTNNVFPSVRFSYRSFREARSYAQQLGLNSRSQWLDFVRDGKKPKDIPTRPDVVYRGEWFTWSDYLGADIASVKRNIETADAVFFIIQSMGRPSNVFQMGITLEGKETILHHQSQHQFRIIGMYYCNIEFDWNGFAGEMGRPYWDGGRNDEFVITNINDFIFQISDFVETIRD